MPTRFGGRRSSTKWRRALAAASHHGVHLRSVQQRGGFARLTSPVDGLCTGMYSLGVLGVTHLPAREKNGNERGAEVDMGVRQRWEKMAPGP